jgi:tRNA-specific 2-thiouridylase
MSGGVDSSLAAALLQEEGHQVIGLMMRLWAEDQNRCCAPAAVDDARRVAAQLRIPFYLVNYEDEFRRRVVDPFIAEYSRGRTPNPCLECNRQIRFGRLLRHAQALGADSLATGHYAQVERSDGEWRLRMGCDAQKDQSYVLYMLGQEELQRVLFPVGQYSKPQVRQMARERGLVTSERDESMELCFVADDDYRRFIREHAPQAVRPGPILDTAGHEIGRHQGLPFYTVGQRKGLGIAASEALYVLRLDLTRNTLVVGPERELGRSAFVAEATSYVRGTAPQHPVRVLVKIRYKASLAEAVWTPLEGRRARVEFTVPLRDITPGQAAVAYVGDYVLGGGIIRE